MSRNGFPVAYSQRLGFIRRGCPCLGALPPWVRSVFLLTQGNGPICHLLRGSRVEPQIQTALLDGVGDVLVRLERVTFGFTGHGVCLFSQHSGLPRLGCRACRIFTNQGGIAHWFRCPTGLEDGRTDRPAGLAPLGIVTPARVLSWRQRQLNTLRVLWQTLLGHEFLQLATGLAGCPRKNRTISALASGPCGSA